eukprot:5254239-Amphidinium_carterae.1
MPSPAMRSLQRGLFCCAHLLPVQVLALRDTSSYDASYDQECDSSGLSVVASRCLYLFSDDASKALNMPHELRRQRLPA